MRSNNNLKRAVFMVLSVLLLSSCGSSTSPDIVSSTGDPEDIAALKKEIDDSEFFSDNLLDESSPEGSGNSVYKTSPLMEQPPIIGIEGTVLPPQFWIRKIDERLNRDIDIQIKDDEAMIKVTSNIAGRLFVDNSWDWKLNPWEKPFHNILRIHAVFKRFQGHWRLDALSPVEIGPSDQSRKTVRIKKITVSSEDKILWESSSPSTLFEFPDKIPVLNPHAMVKVEAEISNSKTVNKPATFAYLHRPGGRDIMWDNGLYGDAAAQDGIFTRQYPIAPLPGRYFALVDAIDYDTFLNEKTDYNAAAWGMPYIVAREYTGILEYLETEDGCWRVRTNEEKYYELANESKSLFEDRTEVIITGIPRPDKAGVCTADEVLDVISVRKMS